MSAIPHSSPKQGKSPMHLHTQWVLLSDDWVMYVIESISLELPLNPLRKGL